MGSVSSQELIPRTVSLEVSEEEAGQRLDKFLATQGPDLSRSQIQRLIQAGQICVHGRPRATASIKVKPGDLIDIHIPPPRPIPMEPRPLSFSIAYEDAHILVLEKPAGLVTHPGAGREEETLVHGLLHHCQGGLSGIGGYLRPGIVHRLDKDTSGLLIVAKDDRSHQALSDQFKAGHVGKTYLALVAGRMADRSGRTDLAVGRHPVQRKKMSTRSRHGRPALTEWTVQEEFQGAALLSVTIHTGRTHQIRVHMASLGHPLLGDQLYGGPRELKRHGEIIAIPRQMLHAHRLSLVHPVTGSPMEWTSEIPGDMRDVIARLRG